jgi:hypothetical protein
MLKTYILEPNIRLDRLTRFLNTRQPDLNLGQGCFFLRFLFSLSDLEPLD